MAGTWLHQDHPVVIRVADPQQGQIEVAWVEEKQGALRLESYPIALRESGDWTSATSWRRINRAATTGPWSVKSRDRS